MAALTGSHILIVDSDAVTRAAIRVNLEAHGAICHPAVSRTEALGMYFMMFDKNIVPRAVISDWYLHPPETALYDFYVSIGEPLDATAYNLVRRVRLVDPDVAVLIYSKYIDEVPESFAVSRLHKRNPLDQLVPTLIADPRWQAHQAAYERQASGPIPASAG